MYSIWVLLVVNPPLSLMFMYFHIYLSNDQRGAKLTFTLLCFVSQQ